MNATWTMMAGTSGVIAALSYFSVFVALCLVAARREARQNRRSLAIFAIFMLFASVNRVLILNERTGFTSWWNFGTSVFATVAAVVIIMKLPQYMRMPKIAEEL